MPNGNAGLLAFLRAKPDRRGITLGSALCPKSCIKMVTLCFVSGMRNLFAPERFFLDHMNPGISKKGL